MSEEIELVAKSTGAVAAALVESLGLDRPGKALGSWLDAWLHPRYVEYAAAQTMRAVEKIRAAGLPVAAVSDRQFKEILEGGALESDEQMREIWDNLLANAMTGVPDAGRRAYPRILRELEPVEAATLQMIAARTDFSSFRAFRVAVGECSDATGIQAEGLENLVRVGVLRYIRQIPTTWGAIDDTAAAITGVMLTDLGWSFLQACRDPGA
jgi:Abortive infection alpha